MSIPAIDAASTLIPLQLNPDRTVQVPPVEKPMQAGWYSPGPTPGEIGSSVILGHVDGHSEAGIFFRLRELRPGGQVLITRQDGITARFVVYQTEQVAKDDFPTDKVYGATARPEVRLITCGGASPSSPRRAASSRRPTGGLHRGSDRPKGARAVPGPDLRMTAPPTVRRLTAWACP
jgi:sortase (surface protein transpeptidase)